MLNRTKIIATLGPACSDKETLEQLILSGVNLVRLNFSHGTHAEHAARVRLVREIATALDKPVAILGDLQGPKLRTGELVDHQPVTLKEGTQILFTTEPGLGTAERIHTDCQQLITDMAPQSLILLQDGSIVLEVLKRVDPNTLSCRVVVGGLLGEHKGINVPGIHLSLPSFTEKDQEDLAFAHEQGIDYIALSFVRTHQDICQLKTLMHQKGWKLPIIAKIEKPQAIEDLHAILEASDGVMVARGDLGVELSLEKVPPLQKTIVQMANQLEKPVIIATQMLESMIHSPFPSRAEASDVANAVYDGADALMLSGETAVGDYPIEVIRMMSKIITEAEAEYSNFGPEKLHPAPPASEPSTFASAIAQAAVFAATEAKAKAIVSFSNSGRMALRISKLRPKQPIVALTPSEAVYRRLALLWGVYPMVVPFGEDTDETLALGEAEITRRNLLATGDNVVFCAGYTPLHGTTNMLKIYHLGNESTPV